MCAHLRTSSFSATEPLSLRTLVRRTTLRLSYEQSTYTLRWTLKEQRVTFRMRDTNPHAAISIHSHSRRSTAYMLTVLELQNTDCEKHVTVYNCVKIWPAVTGNFLTEKNMKNSSKSQRWRSNVPISNHFGCVNICIHHMPSGVITSHRPCGIRWHGSSSNAPVCIRAVSLSAHLE